MGAIFKDMKSKWIIKNLFILFSQKNFNGLSCFNSFFLNECDKKLTFPHKNSRSLMILPRISAHYIIKIFNSRNYEWQCLTNAVSWQQCCHDFWEWGSSCHDFFLLPRFLKKFHRPTHMKKVVILAQFSRNFIVQPLWKNSYFDSILMIFMG